MCGIIGILNRNQQPVDRAVLMAMTRQLHHRGPNDEGVYIDSDGALGFGHRRLSILDLSAQGHQPMLSSDGNIAITFNGEIYNYQELRKQLESSGFQFRSSSDTEVIIAAYQQWGIGCLERFDGMFAFGIWNKKSKELFLARDRYGIKPLYIAFNNSSTILFASEIKAFFPYPEFSVRLDCEGLLEYLSFQNFFTSRTLFQGVQMLEAGSFLNIPYNSTGSIASKRYWDFSFDATHFNDSPAQAEETIAYLFEKAVKKQLVSDVEIGSYLSGGIDSGSISGIAAQHINNLKTFTVGFDLSSASGIELNFDERRIAEQLSYEFKTEHYEIVLKAGDMERCMSSLTWHLEEPRVGQSYPVYYASKLASRFVKVCMSGSGGDELFAGYPWRYFRASPNQSFDEYVDHYFAFWQRMLPGQRFNDATKPLRLSGFTSDPQEIFRSVLTQIPGATTTKENFVNRSLCFEAKTFLHGLLVVEDKLSMAHGLETRVPFLDNDLVDYAMQLPVDLKLSTIDDTIRIDENESQAKSSKFFHQSTDGKLILRSVMKRFVPPEISARRKQGFSAPDASWFKGDSIEYVKRKILSKTAKIFQYIDYETAALLIHEHLSGQVNRRLLIWSLLYLESFLEQFIERPQHELIAPKN
jgi:asparagine synthase (glutamine-hydrolysing)